VIPGILEDHLHHRARVFVILDDKDL